MEGFILDTEQICGRKSMSLRGALQSQANRFVNRFHEERKTKLRYPWIALSMSDERWLVPGTSVTKFISEAVCCNLFQAAAFPVY